jgi:hypothetical protein
MRERAKINFQKNKAKKGILAPKAKKPNLSSAKSSPIDQILSLQKTVGNQAVQKMFDNGIIQAKRKIGWPNDKYEQEAERVAG